jgi:hypothetical protein
MPDLHDNHKPQCKIAEAVAYNVGQALHWHCTGTALEYLDLSKNFKAKFPP